MKPPQTRRPTRVVFEAESPAPPPESEPPTEARPRPVERAAPAASPATAPAAPGADAARVYAAVRDPKPEAIVVHCSDPRFQPAFAQFIREELGLKDGAFLPIVVGGGAGVLGHPEQLPKEFKFLKDRFEYYREVFPAMRRLVLINHENCRYYDEVRSRIQHLIGARLACKLEQARVDLGLVSGVFNRLLAHLGYEVQLYYAHFADAEHSRIVFEKVAG